MAHATVSLDQIVRGRTPDAAAGEDGREAAGVDEHDVVAGAPAAGGGVAEEAGEALAGVGAVEHPAAVDGGPADAPRRRRASPRRSRDRASESSISTSSSGTAASTPISASASVARARTSGTPATTPLATPIASTSGRSSSPSARSSARPATSPAWVPPLDDVCTTAAGVMPRARHCSTSSTKADEVAERAGRPCCRRSGSSAAPRRPR